MNPRRSFYGLALLLFSTMALAGASLRSLDLPQALPDDDSVEAGAFEQRASELAQLLLDSELSDHERSRLAVLVGDWVQADAAARSLEHKRDWGVRRYLSVRATTGYEGSVAAALAKRLAHDLSELDDIAALEASDFMMHSIDRDRSYIDYLLRQLAGRELAAESVDDGTRDLLLRLLSTYADLGIHRELLPAAGPVIQADRERRYEMKTDAVIDTPDGVDLSLMIVRPRSITTPQPAALHATIYANEETNLAIALAAAARGYVGVVSDSRGKRLSTAEITPYENEVTDVTAVVDWLSHHDWTDGRIAMWGGSYVGYTQWAAAKGGHPALKTIVPYVAVIPGQGLPMENNVFLNANYAWSAFVTRAKTNYDAAYDKDFNTVQQAWFQSGRAYREFDAIAGEPNPWLQKWLNHPSFDAYWQSLIPTAADYARIDIPVLSITGYYDDAQISALQYVKDHYDANPDAEHYLLIGPYDHFQAQNAPAPSLRGYDLDPTALIDIPALTFQWFDHVLRGKPRPPLIRDRINVQVMGADSWRHAPSLAAVSGPGQRLFLLPGENGDEHHALGPASDAPESGLHQTVDLADRTTTHNNRYYPYPIVQDPPTITTANVFMTEPFEEAMDLIGGIAGELHVRINKRDFDPALVLYEVTKDGRWFHLNYVLGRASYARDPTRRQLLAPGEREIIPIPRARMVAKRIAAGSRLALLVDVNVNPNAQINYGTGGDVSDETIADAGEPLQVEWLSTSFVQLGLQPPGPK